jgi:hypothetical protein
MACGGDGGYGSYPGGVAPTAGQYGSGGGGARGHTANAQNGAAGGAGYVLITPMYSSGVTTSSRPTYVFRRKTVGSTFPRDYAHQLGRVGISPNKK